MASTSSRGVASAMASHRMLFAKIGAFYLFVLADLRRQTGSDDAAVDQNADAVGEREYRVHVVLDQHDGDFAAQLLQQPHHARGFGDAEARHRLRPPPPPPRGR